MTQHKIKALAEKEYPEIGGDEMLMAHVDYVAIKQRAAFEKGAMLAVEENNLVKALNEILKQETYYHVIEIARNAISSLELKPPASESREGDEVAVSEAKKLGILSGPPLAAFVEGWNRKSAAQPAKPDEGSGLVYLNKKMTNKVLLRVFKKVSLIDLSECEFEYGNGDESDKNGWTAVEEGLWINAMIGGRVVDAIKWDGNIFWMMNNDGSMSPLNPQLPAFIEAGIIFTTDNGKEAKEFIEWILKMIT